MIGIAGEHRIRTCIIGSKKVALQAEGTPQRLKPVLILRHHGAAEAAPFQSKIKPEFFPQAVQAYR